MIKPEWLDFDKRTGKVVPSRRKGSHGYFNAIIKPYNKQLRKSTSYLSRTLAVIADGEATSDEATQNFNRQFKGQIKKPTTQGSISQFLARLDTYGLVEKDEITKKYRLGPGVREILKDGEALYQRAEARRQDLLKLVQGD